MARIVEPSARTARSSPRAAATRETDMRSRARARIPQSTAERVSRVLGSAKVEVSCVLSPHPAAVGAGEAPHAHQQLRGPPPHRHVDQVPGHRPTGYSLGPAGSAERVLKPDRHAALHNGSRRGQELAHSGQSQGIQPQEGRQIRAGEGSLRHVKVSQVACVATPIIEGPRPPPKQRRTHQPRQTDHRLRLQHPQTRRATNTSTDERQHVRYSPFQC